jgi:hypothetical protein
MLDIGKIKDEYIRLKANSEEAYRTLKKAPSVSNASIYTNSIQEYTNFCVDTMTKLIGLPESETSTETALEVIERYCSVTACPECQRVEDYTLCPYREAKELYLQSKS